MLMVSGMEEQVEPGSKIEAMVAVEGLTAELDSRKLAEAVVEEVCSRG